MTAHNEPRPWANRFVDSTGELARILKLPRRTWSPADLETLRHEMTGLLRTRNGTMVLNVSQALALHDIGQFGGLLGPIKVGGGKTLVSLLAPYVLEAKRPLLVAPASLLAKTSRERVEVYQPHWLIPHNLQMRSYEVLGRINAADDLQRINADLIILDEGHRAKNKKAGVTRRLSRFMNDRPDVRVIVLTGTLMKGSIRDFAHLSKWALKKGSPVPVDFGNLEEWADALDEKVNPLRRMEPGELLQLCRPEDWDDVDDLDKDVRAARRGFRRRMVETPGVVATSGEDVAASIYVNPIELDASPTTETNFETLRRTWATPDGMTFLEAVALWRYARQLALGFHYRWEPPAPPEWLAARKDWGRFVRETLSHSRTLDTELQVARACEKGDLDDTAFRAWSAVRSSYTPNPRPVWHDDIALQACQAWMKQGPGIVWTEHHFFAEELARRTGAPYFGAKGVDKKGLPIENSHGVVIASIAANCTGRNLQKWHRNLITSCPSSPITLEQLIGRTHRQGQDSDTVEVEILVGCREQWAALETARMFSRAQADTLPGADTLKLLIADVTWPTDQDIRARPGYRWRQTSDMPKNADSLFADASE